jgi:hypothetical protein
MGILWPAFMAACLLELLVFAMVDPQDIHWSGQPLGLSRMAVYTGAFFAFWIISAVASALALLLARSPAEVNGCPVPVESRPRGCQ